MKEIREILLRGCANDDRTSQKELYQILYAPLYRVSCRYYTNEEDALTAMHNAFLKILDNLEKYRYDKSFMNWSKTILIHVIIDDLRKKKKWKNTMELEVAEANGDATGIENEVEEIIEKEYVNQLLDRLPPASRTVFNLFVFEGYSHKDIARELKISEGTSKWHVSQARGLMKKIIAEARLREEQLFKAEYRQ